MPEEFIVGNENENDIQIKVIKLSELRLDNDESEM